MKVIGGLHKNVKTGLMIIGLTVVVLIGMRIFLSGISNTEEMFETSEVKRSTFEQLISSTGTMEAAGTVDVGTQVSGTISEVFVDYNDLVKKGQILAALDDSLFAAEVKKSKAALLKVRATFKKAENTFVRDKILFKKGHISEEKFINSETYYKQCSADILSAEAALDKAEINLDYTRIKSPLAGTVIERSIEAGQTVAASLSTPTLFIIAEDLSRMKIEADVDESDIGLIKTGQPVHFIVQAYPDNRFEGVVSQIRLNPDIVSNVVIYTVIVDAGNADHLLMPGMTATVDFIVFREKNVMTVPNSALKFRPAPERIQRDNIKSEENRSYEMSINKQSLEEDLVFICEGEQTVKYVRVTKGRTENGVTIIQGDLEEGARVITGYKTEKKKRKTPLLSILRKSR